MPPSLTYHHITTSVHCWGGGAPPVAARGQSKWLITGPTQHRSHPEHQRSTVAHRSTGNTATGRPIEPHTRSARAARGAVSLPLPAGRGQPLTAPAARPPARPGQPVASAARPLRKRVPGFFGGPIYLHPPAAAQCYWTAVALGPGRQPAGAKFRLFIRR